MEITERRGSRRSPFHHPVILNRNKNERCLARILDVGHKGLRVRISSPTDITVGNDIEITSARLHDSEHAVRLSCRVVWENSDDEELGLEYVTVSR